MNPVRDDTATMSCGVCGQPFTPSGRQRWCSTECRQTAWRRTRTAPIPPAPAKTTTVYECGDCGTRSATGSNIGPTCGSIPVCGAGPLNASTRTWRR